MCEIVSLFIQVIEKENSALIMWKLSQELYLLSKRFCKSKHLEQKNDKYTLEILWREAVLYNKYGNLKKEDNPLKQTFTLSYSNHVRRGEAFELIDGPFQKSALDRDPSKNGGIYVTMISTSLSFIATNY